MSKELQDQEVLKQDHPDGPTSGATETASDGTSPKKKHTWTRRDVLAMAGCGIGGLIVGGVLAKWGVIEDTVASGQLDISSTPTKFIVTDRGRCSGCQRCELMCSLRNDGHVSQHTARVRVWENYQFGTSPDTSDGIYKNCEFTIKSCKQCKDAQCMKNCPVHAIHPDPQTGARVVDTDKCIGCGMCHMACPWGMPVVDTTTNKSTKCISCGRCAEQCPNGAIQFIDWQDIAEECIKKGVVSTAQLTGNLIRPYIGS